MIDFLSEWMRGLILIIFLAVVLDMILPNNAMQRYVKLVMGLLIILLMLSPLLKLYGTSVYEMDFTLEKMFAKEGGEMKSLDEIAQKGALLQEQQANNALEQWKAMVAENVKKSVEGKHEVAVDAVELEVTKSEKAEPFSIEHLSVAIMQKRSAGEVKQVREIEPIAIGERKQDETAFASTRVQNELTAKILAQLADEYQVPKSKISVVWQER
ncbi:stage III sporulation protein AF [Tumebacillus lipolyticus]|uniref:Stage III sporulation protein AF n=1 Tax=Tumebacillus lipolyticus TaxID=1280370 RepID=A0ABW4ZZX8_9BACL